MGFEIGEIVGIFPEAAAAELFLFFVLAFFDPPLELAKADVEAGGVRLAAGDFDAALSGVVEGVFRDADHRGGIDVAGQRDFAFFPDFLEMVAPGFLKAGEEKIRAAEKENFGSGRVAARERGEILIDDGFEE